MFLEAYILKNGDGSFLRSIRTGGDATSGKCYGFSSAAYREKKHYALKVYIVNKA